MSAILIDKPGLQNQALEIFTTTNIQKNYIFNYLKGKIHCDFHERSQDGQRPVTALDAACQSLLARKLFPVHKNFRYFGLDYEVARLKTGIQRKLDQRDTLILSDLTLKSPKPFGQFDIVVSSNTLSHIHPIHWPVCSTNLINSVAPTGNLYVNLPNSSGLEQFLNSLAEHFLEVTYFYYTTHLSVKHDGNINILNIDQLRSLIQQCEINAPNISEYAQQVMVCATWRRTFEPAPRVDVCALDFDKIYADHSPKLVNRVRFNNIKDFLSGLIIDSRRTDERLIVAPEQFWNSDDGVLVKNAVNGLRYVSVRSVRELRESFEEGHIETPQSSGTVIFIGTELDYNQTSNEQKIMRETFNHFRSVSTSKNVTLVTVVCSTTTDGRKLTPSDFSVHG